MFEDRASPQKVRSYQRVDLQYLNVYICEAYPNNTASGRSAVCRMYDSEHVNDQLLI